MQDSILRFVVVTCLVLTAGTYIAAQTSAPQGTATVTGRVTVDGRPLANMQILLAPAPKEDDGFLQRMTDGGGEARKATTDGDGRYRFNDVAAGSYQVKVFAPTLATDKAESSVRVSEGETAEDVNFALKAAGIITGSILLPDGRPAIGQLVQVQVVTPKKAAAPRSPDEIAAEAMRQNRSETTDDRGVYRVYGLPPGEYLVSAAYGGGRRESVHTYYPGATEQDKAVAVKVKAGGETTGIDFKLGLSKKKGYEVRGRVVDESGKPVSGVMLSCGPAHDEGEDGKTGSGISAVSDMIHSNSQGEFKIHGVTQGKYSLSIMSMFDEASVYSDPVTFQVGNGDVDGVEIKTHKGLTASGTAVIEGNDDPAIASQLSQVQLMGMVRNGQQFNFSMSRATLGPDGSFVMRGLSPGKLRLMVSPLAANSSFALLRVERGGVSQKDGVEIAPDSPVTDIKLVLGYGNCTIYGRATVEGGTLPKGSHLYVHISRQTSDASSGPGVDMFFDNMGMGRSATGRTIDVSPGGEFRAEGLVPGDYQVSVSTNKYSAPPAPPPPPAVSGAPAASPPDSDDDDDDDDDGKSSAQKVTLTSGAALEVNVKLNVPTKK